MKSHNEYEKEIISIIKKYYGNEKSAYEWYNNPHAYIDKKLSPKEMVENGKGENVLDWIKMVLEIR